MTQRQLRRRKAQANLRRWHAENALHFQTSVQIHMRPGRHGHLVDEDFEIFANAAYTRALFIKKV